MADVDRSIPAVGQSVRHPLKRSRLRHMSTEKVSTFIDRHLFLLSQERDSEVERTSLLFSKCGPKLLEQKGLALNGLGIASIGVGLGNKTCVYSRFTTSIKSTTLRSAVLSNWSVQLHIMQLLFSPHIHFGATSFWVFPVHPKPRNQAGRSRINRGKRSVHQQIQEVYQTDKCVRARQGKISCRRSHL